MTLMTKEQSELFQKKLEAEGNEMIKRAFPDISAERLEDLKLVLHEIGEYSRKTRLANGIGLRDMAKIWGISNSHLSKIESAFRRFSDSH